MGRKEPSTEELKKIDTYPFIYRVYICANSPDAEKALTELKTTTTEKIALSDIYLTLKLLGYKYLAYIFQAPQTKPWDQASQQINNLRTTVYNSYAYHAGILFIDKVEEELDKLEKWLKQTTWRNPEFRKTAQQVIKLDAEINTLKYGTEPQELLPTTNRELEEQIQTIYNELKETINALQKTRKTLQKHRVDAIIELWCD